MKKISTTLKLCMALLGSLLMSVPLSAQYMSWDNMNPMDSLPVKSPWRSRDDVLDFSSIVPDPDIAGNNLLKINDFSGINRRGSFRYDWRLNAEDPNVPADSLNGVTGITIVFRAKPTTQAIQADSFVVWWYISIRASGLASFQTDLEMRKDSLRLVGFNAYPPGGPDQFYSMIGDTSWHTWRVTQIQNNVKVYMDEDPTPVFDTKTYGTDVGANHLRIGKQDRGAPYGGYFDYFLILEGAIYAPGEGPAIPEGYKVDGGASAVHLSAANDPGISVFPNPSEDYINVEYTRDITGNIKVEIYSVLGQEVMTTYEQAQSGNNQFRLNIQDLDPGIYILKVNGRRTRFIKR